MFLKDCHFYHNSNNDLFKASYKLDASRMCVNAHETMVPSWGCQWDYNAFTVISHIQRQVLFNRLAWISLAARWNYRKCLTVFKCLNGFCPPYLSNLFCLNSDVHSYNTRFRNNIHMSKVSSNSDLHSFSAAKLYNTLNVCCY